MIIGQSAIPYDEQTECRWVREDTVDMFIRQQALRGETNKHIAEEIERIFGWRKTSVYVAERIEMMKTTTKKRQWSWAEDEELVRLAPTGMSSRQIGERLKKTKNAIIGRCHRLHIELGRDVGGNIKPPPEPPKPPVHAETPQVVVRDHPDQCATPGCLKTRLKPYALCHVCDQARIAAKKMVVNA